MKIVQAAPKYIAQPGDVFRYWDEHHNKFWFGIVASESALRAAGFAPESTQVLGFASTESPTCAGLFTFDMRRLRPRVFEANACETSVGEYWEAITSVEYL